MDFPLKDFHSVHKINFKIQWLHETLADVNCVSVYID